MKERIVNLCNQRKNLKEGIKKAPKTWRGGRSSGQETFKKISDFNIQDSDQKVNPENHRSISNFIN
jgi:hypothetical protein